MPKAAPRRRLSAMAAAASSAFDGTQPALRQSPPMAPRSISTTSRPSCAAPAATTSPAEPAPTMQTSGVRISVSSAVTSATTSATPAAAHEAAVQDRHQRQHAEPQQRQQDCGMEDHAEVGHLAALEQRAEARADAGEHDRAGNDAD